jgi:gliding motility-associated-like protein
MKGVETVVIFLSLIFLYADLSAQVQLQNGLVAEYKFDGNVKDAAANKFDGAIVGKLAYTEDRFGNPNSAIQFDGDGSYIKISDNGAFSSSEISISLWFKSNSDELQVLLGKRSFGDDGTPSGGAQYQFFINYNLYPGIGSNLVGNNSSCTDVSGSSYLNSVDPICRERWYHAVITYDGTYHKIYINGILKRNEQTTFNRFLQCTSELRLGIWWALDKRPFIGLMDDVRWYNRALNQQEVFALFNNYAVPSQLDFTYSQNVCSPKTITFSSTNTSAISYRWDFGNGVSGGNSANPIVNYNSFGTYPVELLSETSPGCVDTARKLISISLFHKKKIITSDTSICKGTELNILTDSGYQSCWSPNEEIKGTTANVVVKPTTSSTFFFTTLASSAASLVANGDFSSGNLSFSSGYSYSSSNTNNSYGQYGVTNDANNWNSSAKKCANGLPNSHGKMLLISSNTNEIAVWHQTLSVSQNTNYLFGFSLQTLSSSPAKIQLAINNNLVGDVNISTDACEWKRYYVTWNSGDLTQVSLAIVNKNDVNGVISAIDDIYFQPASMVQDSIKVNVVPPPSVRAIADTAICEGASIKLNASGVTTYRWTPAKSLSDTSIQNPTATPPISTNYIVSGYNVPGCVGIDTVTINVLPKPAISVTNDTTVCAGNSIQLNASGGAHYLWSPSATLSAGDISNPIAKPTSTTRFIVDVKDNNGCSNSDSVTVAIAKPPSVTSISDTTVCSGTSVNLTTASLAGVTYTWYPASGLNNSTVPSPVATPSQTTDYIITASSAKDCQAKDTVHISVLPAPSVTTGRDTTICSGRNATLFASGGVSYHWSPSTGLSDPNVYNPIASSSQTTVYAVTVTGTNGCTTADSIKLTVRPASTFDLQPKASAICLNDNVTLTASGGDEYEWLPTTGIGSATTNVTLVKPSETTTYKVRIYDSVCNHTDTLSAAVIVNPLPTVSINKSNDIDCTIVNAHLVAMGGRTYSWTPSIGLSNSSISNPIASPLTSTFYSVKVTDAKGCSNTDSIQVVVAFGSNVNGFYLPNAFTPNGDGKNDCFGIKSWGPVSDVDFSIFNRWGERVFYSKNASGCWDGNYNNMKQDTGSFIYVIKAKSVCGGEINKKGTVLLIR